LWKLNRHARSPPPAGQFDGKRSAPAKENKRMSRNPAKRTAHVALGVASLHRKDRLLQARPPCPAAARRSATLGLLRKLLGWTYRRSDRPLLDGLSDHVLRDIGIEPDGREDKSNFRFWRGR
jgi:uncharacterized protein YjiS (DUF1127 family)